MRNHVTELIKNWQCELLQTINNMICNSELYDRKPNSAVQSQQSRKMIKF